MVRDGYGRAEEKVPKGVVGGVAYRRTSENLVGAKFRE
jgi:hypothetical protein